MITFLCCSWKNYPELFLLLKAIRVKIMPVKNDTLSSHISSLPVIQQQFSSTFVSKDFLFYFIFPALGAATTRTSPVFSQWSWAPSCRCFGWQKVPWAECGWQFCDGEGGRGAQIQLLQSPAGFPPQGSGHRQLEVPPQSLGVTISAGLMDVVAWEFKQLFIRWEKSNYICEIINSFSLRLG